MKNYLTILVLFLCCLISCTEADNEASVSQAIDGGFNIQLPGDNYDDIVENPFINTPHEATSTFSVDADGASYANVRRFIQEGLQIPPANAIRTEELINYFDLEYPYTDTTHPINLNGEVSSCPWNSENKLVRIGIKGKPIPEAELPASNFVFLIDVSGSMSSEDKLELLKNGFNLFVDELTEQDRVAIVTYAGSAAVVLPSTTGDQKQTIKNAINNLGSGGGTAGAEGIITAYEIAQQNFIDGGNNRIIVGTDGDFNIGPSSTDDLITLIEEKRDFGVFLTVLGVGRGNLNDSALEQIANNGNGTYEYIDTVEQLRKVFIYDYNKFFTVAKDVKVQVQFNPENILAYRLIGYENRVLDNEDFEDDEEDAGEIGANQNITAIYEIVPQSDQNLSEKALTLDFRYKNPDEDVSIPISLDLFDEGNSFEQASDFMQFTASISSFSMLLRDSQYKGTSSYNQVVNWLDNTSLTDQYNFKAQLRDLVQQASGF